MRTISDYESVVGEDFIEELKCAAKHLDGKVIQMVNSTAVGGGVAELLNHMVPLLKDLGVDTRWDVIKGGEKFFQVTKALHNALHGKEENITEDMIDEFKRVTEENLSAMELYGDIMFVHDPQPIGLIKAKNKFKDKKWIWRCHIDISNPYRKAWEFLEPYILMYDASVVSAPNFTRTLPIPQFLISPSIDPFSDKNKELPEAVIKKVFQKYKIDMSRAVITQISRFDYLKDPIGVIQAYRMVKKYEDCQLVLAGGAADDDPESLEVLAKVMAEAEKDRDIFVLNLPPFSDIEINALQRGSTIILQKSIKEGFGLTVTEALWKGKPVVASAVGGITRQIRKHRITGLLVHSVEGCAYMIRQLLTDSDFADRLGKAGREHVRHNFLVTRHIKDYMLMFLSLYYPGKSMVYL